jgi:hypothetical protein
MGLAQHRRQTSIALGRPSEDDKMIPAGVRHPHSIIMSIKGHFNPEDSRDPERACRLGEAHHAVETVMISQS